MFLMLHWQRVCISILVATLVLLGGISGCRRGLSDAEKATRAELRQALREGAYERAVVLAQQVLDAHPKENGAWQRLVQAQIGLGNLDAARKSLSSWRAAVRNPSAKYDELTGDVAAKEGDLPRAAERWGRAADVEPWNVELLAKLAEAYRTIGRSQEEDAVLTQLLHLQEDGVTLMQRALCRRRLHRWTEALEDYRRALQLAPEDPEVRRGARLLERLTKFLDEIRKLDARIAVTPQDDQLLTDRALLFLRCEDPQLGLEDSRAAAKLAPAAMRPRLFAGAALLLLDRAEEAEQLGVNRTLRLEALSAEFLETISRLDAEISVERDNADLYVQRAWQLNEIQQPVLALSDAETALKHSNDSAAARVESAYALAKLGRGLEALEHVRQATEIDEHSATAWQYRGELEMSRGDHLAAVESLTKAITISQSPAALKKREECYRHLGLVAKADADLRAYEALNQRSM
jgi:tetratricopeptide (TPR) repeat protein